MKLQNQFTKRIGAALLAASMCLPSFTAFAEDNTAQSGETFELVVAVHYQELSDSINADAANKHYEGINAGNEKYDINKITKMYVVDVPVDTTGYDLLKQSGISCYEYNRDYMSDGSGNKKGKPVEVKFNEFEGVSLVKEDAVQARTVTKASTMGDGEYAGAANNIHLHYDRNVYSLFVDANGGELPEGIKPQYDFFYGEELHPNTPYGNREKIYDVMRGVWDSQPRKGVRGPDGKIEAERQDKFIDWRIECKTADKMYASHCTEVENNTSEISFGSAMAYLGFFNNGCMPATDIVMRAHWRSTESPVTVIYNLQNADDNKYSVIGKDTIYMPSGMRIINHENKYHHNGNPKTQEILRNDAPVTADYNLNLSVELSKVVYENGGQENNAYDAYVTGTLGDMSNFLVVFNHMDKSETGTASKTKTAKVGIADKEGKNSDVELTITVKVDENSKPSVSLDNISLVTDGGDGFTSRYSGVGFKEAAPKLERVDKADKDYIVSFEINNNTYPVETDLYNLESKLTNDTIFADKDYFSFYYCDAFQELNEDGTVRTKDADKITTVDYEGNTVVNVYYTRNYYALQFHLSREIIGSYVDITDTLPGSSMSYQKKAWEWGVTGRAWALATLTRSRHGYVSTGDTYDWRKEGSTDPYNRLGNYDAFGSDDGIFSWGPNMAGDPWNPNYVFFDNTGNKARPSIQIGGVQSTMGPINKVSDGVYSKPAEQTEYTIIARYGADIREYWPTGDDKVVNAVNLPTWDKYDDKSPNLFEDIDGNHVEKKRYRFYTWQTNYDTIFHASRIDVQDIVGEYSSLDKNLIVQGINGTRVDHAPQASAIPTARPDKPSLKEFEESYKEEDFTLPEDVFTPEAMDQEVNLGSEGEIEDFVVDENEMPDDSYFDPTDIENNEEHYGTVELNGTPGTTPVPQANLTIDSTKAREVRFEEGSVPDEPVYLATPNEGLAPNQRFEAQEPTEEGGNEKVAKKIQIESVGYKHDLFAFWNPLNRNWGHTYHYCFEDPNAANITGDEAKGKLWVKEDELVNETVKLAASNGGNRNLTWRHFPAWYYDSETGEKIELLAADQYRLDYSGTAETGSLKPEMPEGFTNPVFIEKESKKVNTVEPNVSQNAPAMKGYRLYYVGHTDADERKVRPDGDKGSDIYMFYVPERYKVTYVTYPGQPANEQVTRTVKYGQNLSSDLNLKAVELENNEEILHTQHTTFGQECTFDGWYYDATYKNKVDFTDKNYKFEGGVTLYGKWNPPTHTVTFNMRGFKMDQALLDHLSQYGTVQVGYDRVVVTGVPNGTKAEDLIGKDYETHIPDAEFVTSIGTVENVKLRFDHWEKDKNNERYAFGAGQYITENLTVNAMTLDDRGYVCYILRNDQTIAYYTSVNAALKEYTDNDYKIVMLMDTKEDIDIAANMSGDRTDKKLLLDFHGCTITGNVEVSDEYRFYGIDTMTDQFGTDYVKADQMGGAYGGLIGNFVTDLHDPTNTITKPEDNIDDYSKITATKDGEVKKSYTYDYVSYQEPNGWSFHRVYSDVWANVIKINNNTASMTLLTGYYGDSKAKEVSELGANIADTGLEQSKGSVSGGSEALMGVNFYKTVVDRSGADNKFTLVPTIKNNNGVINGTSNVWLSNVTGYSVADAMRMAIGRYGRVDVVGNEGTYANNSMYLGNVEQYSDYSDSVSNRNNNPVNDPANNPQWYTKTDVDRMTTWLGIAAN